MDLALQPEEEELVRTYAELLTRESSPERVRAAEDLGFDPHLWSALVGIGVPAMAVGPEAADLLQLCLVAEQAGRHLASAPLVESFVIARALARATEASGPALLAACEDGAIATLVLRETADRRSAPLVPAGAIADIIVSFDGTDLVAVVGDPPGVATPNLGSQPLADRDLTAGRREVIATGDDARAVFATAQAEWKLLTAALLVGVAARALEIGVTYAREREVFDRPIATFQTVAHRLADLATAVDGARLLVHEAAWTADEGRVRAAELATMAFCFAAETAPSVAGDALHFHGGYGYTLEYDIQLYYRRAKAYGLVWGGVERELGALADELFGPVGAPKVSAYER